jgi:hypothetical protein
MRTVLRAVAIVGDLALLFVWVVGLLAGVEGEGAGKG